MSEIAADPKSRLFSRPYAPWTRLAGSGQAVSAAAIDATTAERRLLDVFREETAALMRRLCALLAAETELGQFHFRCVSNPVVVFDVTARDGESFAGAASRLERVLSSERAETLPLEFRALLQRFSLGYDRPEDWVGPIQRASEALLPSDVARVLAGIVAYVGPRDFSHAEALSAGAARSAASPWLAAVAWNNAARCAYEAGRIEHAHGHACKATSVAPDYLDGWIQRLLIAAGLSLPGSFRMAAEAVESFGDAATAHLVDSNAKVIRLRRGRAAAETLQWAETVHAGLAKGPRMLLGGEPC